MKQQVILTEDKLRNIVKEEISNALNESTMNRVADYIKNYECATITAWRNTLQDTTDSTFKPNHISHNKEKINGKVVGRGIKIIGEPMQQGEDFSTEEKKYYNRELKAALLSLGYGVTQIRGSYKECGQTESQEESLLVVNLKDDPKFKEKIFKLSEYYNQDSFMYSPKGSDEGILIGTNNAPFPGYKNEIPNGKFKRDVQSMFMSRIGNKGFSFTNGEKVNKNVPNREEKLDNGDNNYETDEPLTFSDRKKQRMGESAERLLQIETYDRYGINAKRAIKYYANNLLNEISISQKKRNVKDFENAFKKGKKGFNAIKTIVVFTSENPDSQQMSSQFNKKIKKSLLHNIKQGGYAFVPAIGQFGNAEHPYAVFNMSIDTAKMLNGKYQQTSFIFSKLNNDGSIHSEYWEKNDESRPYDKGTNDYVMKDQCDEWKDMANADDYFTIVGKKFKYSIPFSIFEDRNRAISNNAIKLVEQEGRRSNATNINEEKLIEDSINKVGISPYLWRKALTKGINS